MDPESCSGMPIYTVSPHCPPILVPRTNLTLGSSDFSGLCPAPEVSGAPLEFCPTVGVLMVPPLYWTFTAALWIPVPSSLGSCDYQKSCPVPPCPGIASEFWVWFTVYCAAPWVHPFPESKVALTKDICLISLPFLLNLSNKHSLPNGLLSVLPIQWPSLVVLF